MDQAKASPFSDGDESAPLLAADDPRLVELLHRCERARRRLARAAAVRTFSAAALPGVAIAVALALLLHTVGHSAYLAAAAGGLWMAGCAVWTRRSRDRRSVPPWLVPARLDRDAGARGSLMAVAEKGRGGPVPARVLATDLPRPAIWPIAAQWSVLAATWGALFTLPTAQPARMPLTPIPVERAREQIDDLRQYASADDALLRTATATLERMSRRSEGLDAEDLAALDRINQLVAREKRQIQRSSQRNRALLSEVETELSRLAALDTTKADTTTRHEGETRRDSSAAASSASSPRGGGAQTPQRAASRHQAQSARLKRAASRHQAQNARLKRAVERARREGSFGSAERECLAAAAELADSGVADGAAARRLAGEIARGARRGSADTESRPTGGTPARGPGTAPLYGSNQARMHSEQFAAMPFDVESARSTVLLGEVATAPQPDREQLEGAGTPASSREFARGVDTPFRKHQLLPQHRAIVRAYFGPDRN